MNLKYNEIDKHNINSKLLKEYINIKDANKDFIVLFQVGEFFETYFEDAKIFSDTTGAILTSKKIKEIGNFNQSGIPINSLNIYVKKLLDKNHKICICRQFKTNENTYYRKVTRKYTKGTIYEQEYLDSCENNYIGAIYQEKEVCNLVYADVSTGQFFKTKDNIEIIKEELKKISPAEIIISENQTKIFEKIFKEYNTTIIEENNFNNKKLEDVIVYYCKNNQKNYTTKLNPIQTYNIRDYLIIDNLTRKYLELNRINYTLKKKGSLFWILNKTKTPMGARLLKKYINEPLKNKNEIQKRQNIISILLKNKILMNEVSSILDDFCDISRSTAKISNNTISPADLYNLGINILQVKELLTIKSKNITDFINIKNNNYTELFSFSKKILSALNNDKAVNDDYIIKAGYNTKLDYLKAKLANNKNEISSYRECIEQNNKIGKVKVGNSASLGYYIEIANAKEQNIPKIFYKIQTLSNSNRYKTEKIKKLEEEIFNLTYQINRLENTIYKEIIQESNTFTDKIRELAKDIAQIDVMLSLTQCAKEFNFTKPNFNKEKIEIQNGYHPNLLFSTNKIVKNDTILENEKTIILTGANMSGKSTFLKQNAIICILAQIGSFVPADYANAIILDKIFYRQSSLDDISNKNSSFMVEMKDLKYILENATLNSLILLDEPAKSTNEKSGGAIARAYIEYISENKKTKTIIATHNLELTKCEKSYPDKINNFYIEEENELLSSRKINKGISKQNNAIKTAEICNFPVEIINKSKQYLCE